ncbi:hypothetical protein AAFF_G00138990 [Aldrovandia affinis]|uniref:Uncharacterized protein n=1 Tax=Aldrovandia affinis TaxID=143900 RepID=A0AAD7TC56_9TELE|nr:hypothetical protein AAFF_G00138990 [Aldrovandia affinis]
MGPRVRQPCSRSRGSEVWVQLVTPNWRCQTRAGEELFATPPQTLGTGSFVIEHCTVSCLHLHTCRNKGDTMSRISLIISIALFLYGSTAMPLSSSAKLETLYQETLKSEEFNGKVSLGMKEVEPPEDMAVTDDDIEPGMAIWKAAKRSRGQKHATAEEDKDDLYSQSHLATEFTPSLRRTETSSITPLADALEAHKLRGANPGPQEAFQNDPPAQPYKQAELDMDDLFHGFPGVEGQRIQVQKEQRRPMVYTQPEEDRDDLYHRSPPDQHPRQQPQVQPEPQPEPRGQMIYTHPEEDRDHLYHN